MKKAFAIIPIAVVLAMGIVIASVSWNGFQKSAGDLEKTKQMLSVHLQEQIDACYNKESTPACVEGIKGSLEECKLFGNPEPCNDPRIQAIINP